MIKDAKAAKLLRNVLRRLLFLLCLGIGGALLSATLVRFAPGYGVEERELDPRWSAQSVEALRQKQGLQEGLASFYFRYLSALAHGDLGGSDSLKRPVLELLRQRLPVTGNSVVRGLGVAWLPAALLASLGLASRGWLYEASGTAFSSLLLAERFFGGTSCRLLPRRFWLFSVYPSPSPSAPQFPSKPCAIHRAWDNSPGMPRSAGICPSSSM